MKPKEESQPVFKITQSPQIIRVRMDQEFSDMAYVQIIMILALLNIVR
jgi:hypothetical protein